MISPGRLPILRASLTVAVLAACSAATAQQARADCEDAAVICIQFFGEALLLALSGSGIVICWLVTFAHARLQGWPFDMPLSVAAGGMGATLVIGGIAGLHLRSEPPAWR